MKSWPDVRGLAASLAAGLLDLIYPPKCLVCETLQPRYLCPECLEKIALIESYTCRRCGAPIEEPYCRECSGRELHFDSVNCVAVYDGVLREAIHQLKYSGHSVLVPELAELMIGFYRGPLSFNLRKTDVILPVPTDREREKERGFNQSELLARMIGSAVGKPVLTNVLKRARKSHAQSNLSYEQRLINLIGAFSVSNPESIQAKSLLLVDDVYTTGSTADEAAKVLKAAGALEVHVFTLARSV